MKPRLAWHRTPLGRVACFLGSIKPAVPIMLGASVALAYGTIVESTENAEVAKRVVYGSWWFIALMTYICLALIFAVVVRFPWHRRHTGFIIVHAGIIVTIVGGFISLFGRVEGLMTLREGMMSSEIERPGSELEVYHIPQVDPVLLASFPLSARSRDNLAADLETDGMKIQIVEEWGNSEARTVILNDSAEPLEAIQYTTSADNVEGGHWLGQSRVDDPRSKVFDGIQLRVLAANTPWEPEPVVEDVNEEEGEGSEEAEAESGVMVADVPASPDASRHTFFALGEDKENHVEVGEVGELVNADWRIKEVKYFNSASVNAEGLVEGEGADNPAVQILIENVNDGTIERHIAFSNYPEMLIVRLIQGETLSGLNLYFEQTGVFHAGRVADSRPHDSSRNRIVFQNNQGVFKATWVRPDGSVKVFDLSGEAPFTLDLDGQILQILQHFTHARSGEEFIQRPVQKENRPVLVVEVTEGYTTERLKVPWKGQAPLMREGASRPVLFRYGPKRYQLPMQIQLIDFRKNDYPGSRMAMEYESDVRWAPVHVHVEGDDHSALPEPVEQKIWMNNPLEYEGWKVYQSGFMGDDISTFSIMKDPGLTLTYIGCLLLCGGILVMFYSKNYSHGHPGIAHYTKSGNVKSRVVSGSTVGHQLAADSIPLTAELSDTDNADDVKKREQEGAAA